jgi:type III secretory pathway component EscV
MNDEYPLMRGKMKEDNSIFLENKIIVIITLVILLIIPLPALLLDIFIAGNLIFALMTLLIGLFSKKISNFTLYPSLLHVSIFFNLMVNISATRLIMTRGAEFDGWLINFISLSYVGPENDNLITGSMLFIAIIAIHAIILTKGCTRLSEVVAKFTLDSFPVKQMAVDTEYIRGAITENEASLRNEKLQMEVDFYSSLDGIGNFLLYDEKIRIIIITISSLSVIIIGALLRRQTISDAINFFIPLILGNGILCILPSLLLFIAIGCIITHYANSDFKENYFDYTSSNIFANSESLNSANMIQRELLSESSGMQYCQKDIILFSKIKPKKMFYNIKEAESIHKLNSLLQEENYLKVLDRLESKGMRKGFACLFSGGPGTGKTETAWQIARNTKRNVMKVDISDTKDMLVGESEKKIKAIFDAYQAAVDNSEITPILLFNEADAVIGKRKIFNSSMSAVDQMENTIQNIILQEMENFTGILIATTNLTQNMDSAFERRFLYKINFDKPSVESRKGIWNALLPDLPDDKAAELSRKYDLSGGQIENIARKIEVDAIITGGDFSLDTLVQYCKDEIQNRFNSVKRIGFGE